VISFFLLLVLVVTGIWLMFFYVPSVERAYTDMQNLETGVTFGMLMRNMHRWAAHLMVVTVFLHMCRVFFTGGYKHPREFNWVIGVMLWVLTLILSLTGYLLPWDQLSYWAITVSTNIVGTIPLIGDKIRAPFPLLVTRFGSSCWGQLRRARTRLSDSIRCTSFSCR
jgi:quinol-cytochrome oxidoreductase complex cytochrome b subunit